MALLRKGVSHSGLNKYRVVTGQTWDEIAQKEKAIRLQWDIEWKSKRNQTSAKELKAMLDKIAKRSKQFRERGFYGVIRDGVRARIFMPDADKNYMKIVEAMEKKHYKIAKNFEEDAQGNLILGPDCKPSMIDDIDVRFGKKACASGYEDVQIRFKKGDVLYELIILPGPHYLSTANREHELLYEQLRKYKAIGLDKDAGAKQIISAIEEYFYKLSKSWYAEAKLKDKKGMQAVSKTVSFEHDDIKNLNELFISLKNLCLGKWDSLPPSKKNVPTFRDTKIFASIHEIENELRKLMDMYKPVD